MENNWIARHPFFLLKAQPVVSHYYPKTDRNYINKDPINKKEVLTVRNSSLSVVYFIDYKFLLVTVKLILILFVLSSPLLASKMVVKLGKMEEEKSHIF